jgi:CHASE2 domain-containing sensor protein
MPADFDGVVRFWRSFELIDGYPRPTLPWAAVQEYCRAGHDKCPKSKGKQVETHPPAFTTDVSFQSIRLSDFLTEAPKEFPVSCPILAPDSRLKDRIVVLGGTYSRADLHETPWGSRQGGELVAMAIEQVFDPAPLHEVAEYFIIGLELAIAFLIATIHHWIRPIPATVFTLILLPLGMIVSAELMFLFGDYEVGIVPFMLGLLIHQLVGSAERAEHMTRRLEHTAAVVP